MVVFERGDGPVVSVRFCVGQGRKAQQRGGGQQERGSFHGTGGLGETQEGCDQPENDNPHHLRALRFFTDEPRRVGLAVAIQ